MFDFRERANNEAIYNLYLYAAHKIEPRENEPLRLAVDRLNFTLKGQSAVPKPRELARLEILKNAITASSTLANSQISNITLSDGGLSACVFTRPDGSVSVIFKGTGAGEWIDNGEGLSGIPEENIYVTYKKDGGAVRSIVNNDFSSDQQVESLNWFRKVSMENKWTDGTEITLSGHSKGGNKAQFVNMHSSLADYCFSFNGQGFSPEAITMLRSQLGEDFEKRRSRIYGLSTANDFVSALGERLVPDRNLHFFCPRAGSHFVESMLETNGILRAACPKSKLFEYIEAVSAEIMQMKPSVRRLATLGVMNVCQKYFGSGVPVNGDSVSVEATIAGIGIAIASVLRQLTNISNG